jgi:hypothetical protein
VDAIPEFMTDPGIQVFQTKTGVLIYYWSKFSFFEKISKSSRSGGTGGSEPQDERASSAAETTMVFLRLSRAVHSPHNG